MQAAFEGVSILVLMDFRLKVWCTLHCHGLDTQVSILVLMDFRLKGNGSHNSR